MIPKFCHLLKVLLWLILPIILIIESGCARGVYYRAYPGIERPLDKTSILLVAEGVNILKIDGNDIPHSIFEWVHEVALLPGVHSIEADYSSYNDSGTTHTSGGSFTTLNFFAEGYIYDAKPLLNESTLKWRMEITQAGTIKDFAPIFAKQTGAQPW